MNSVKTPSRRLARWIDDFQAYKIDIQYRKGADAIVPDALSRRPDFQLNAILQYDDVLSAMEQYLMEKTLPKDAQMRERILKEASDFVMEDGRLFKRIAGGMTPCIEPLFRGDFMEKMHSQFGHLSYAGMAQAIESRAWWPGMEADM